MNMLYNAGGRLVTSCPCRNCVCLAMCKQKHIRTLLNDCSIASNYVRPHGTDEVDGFAVENLGSDLGRNFRAIHEAASDRARTIIRDQDKYEKMKEDQKLTKRRKV